MPCCGHEKQVLVAEIRNQDPEIHVYQCERCQRVWKTVTYYSDQYRSAAEAMSRGVPG